MCPAHNAMGHDYDGRGCTVNEALSKWKKHGLVEFKKNIILKAPRVNDNEYNVIDFKSKQIGQEGTCSFIKLAEKQFNQGRI